MTKSNKFGLKIATLAVYAAVVLGILAGLRGAASVSLAIMRWRLRPC